MDHETRVICTLGPSSGDFGILHKMAEAGMDIVRLNFSHGDHKSHKQFIDMIKSINYEYGFDIKILQDLEGYRIRVGHLSKSIEVNKNETVKLSTQGENLKEKILSFDYSGSFEEFELRSELFIDDGKLRFKITHIEKDALHLKVLQGGVIKSRKGINIPDLEINMPSLSEKDAKDIQFGIKNSVDYIAQSFVTSVQDIELLKKQIKKTKKASCKIISKIENRSGIKNIDSIIKASDGVMVARGDLGISVPVYKVPIIQKYIVHRCNRLKKTAIIATQMLESMTLAPYPTRAEVSDIANAIIDGADYIMLSGETAAGQYPLKAVQMMKKIVGYTEKNINLAPLF